MRMRTSLFPSATVGWLVAACAATQPAASPPPPAEAPAPVEGTTPAASPGPIKMGSQVDGGDGWLSGNGAAAGTDVALVALVNPLDAPRSRETIALALADLAKSVAGLAPEKLFFVDAAGTPVLSQLVDMDGDLTLDQIVFQVDLAARESKTVK